MPRLNLEVVGITLYTDMDIAAHAIERENHYATLVYI